MSLQYLVKYECKKWHHSEIRIAINDESQGSIAKNMRCDELLYYTFIILMKLLLSIAVLTGRLM